MTHDPLCPIEQACSPELGSSDGSHFLYNSDHGPLICGHCDRLCCCDLIAKVRADERKQAGARVAERPYWEDGWPENLVMNRSSAIDAAEGGDGE